MGERVIQIPVKEKWRGMDECPNDCYAVSHRGPVFRREEDNAWSVEVFYSRVKLTYNCSPWGVCPRCRIKCRPMTKAEVESRKARKD